jgi:hypothetical protein
MLLQYSVLAQGYAAHLFVLKAWCHISTNALTLLKATLSITDLRRLACRRITEPVRCFRIALAPIPFTTADFPLPCGPVAVEAKG